MELKCNKSPKQSLARYNIIRRLGGGGAYRIEAVKQYEVKERKKNAHTKKYRRIVDTVLHNLDSVGQLLDSAFEKIDANIIALN